jgi:hypothetical protein
MITDENTIKYVLKYNNYLAELSLCFANQGFKDDLQMFDLFKIVDEIIGEEER